jgi:hypothetical protein
MRASFSRLRLSTKILLMGLLLTRAFSIPLLTWLLKEEDIIATVLEKLATATQKSRIA